MNPCCKKGFGAQKYIRLVFMESTYSDYWKTMDFLGK